jgi:hypothetical protein
VIVTLWLPPAQKAIGPPSPLRTRPVLLPSGTVMLPPEKPVLSTSLMP